MSAVDVLHAVPMRVVLSGMNELSSVLIVHVCRLREARNCRFLQIVGLLRRSPDDPFEPDHGAKPRLGSMDPIEGLRRQFTKHSPVVMGKASRIEKSVRKGHAGDCG